MDPEVDASGSNVKDGATEGLDAIGTSCLLVAGGNENGAGAKGTGVGVETTFWGAGAISAVLIVAELGVTGGAAAMGAVIGVKGVGEGAGGEGATESMVVLPASVGGVAVVGGRTALIIAIICLTPEKSVVATGMGFRR